MEAQSIIDILSEEISAIKLQEAMCRNRCSRETAVIYEFSTYSVVYWQITFLTFEKSSFEKL